MGRRYQVRVLYKSGNSIQFWCEDLEYEGRNGQVTKLTWKNAEPRPVFAGIDNIEAIYQLNA